jgi:hypothetical protein
MKLLFILILFFCGGAHRWNVKTLQDQDAGNVNFNYKNTSVESLTKLKRPAKIGNNTVRQKIEFNTYTVKATVQDYFKEADGDIHIVLQDIVHPHITMIAEIPDYTCDKVYDSKYVNQFKKVRQKFLSIKKASMIGSKHYFTGVAFFDETHGTGQTGHAPNNIELHPLIEFN